MCLTDPRCIPSGTAYWTGSVGSVAAAYAIIFAGIKLFFAKVASISWGRCKVKNKCNSKPENSQSPVLQRYIRSTSLRFPSDSKAID